MVRAFSFVSNFWQQFLVVCRLKTLGGMCSVQSCNPNIPARAFCRLSLDLLEETEQYWRLCIELAKLPVMAGS